MKHNLPLHERLINRSDKIENGCWIWNACRSDKGYGLIGYAGKSRRAHRLAWEVFRGPIPKGAQVLHRCDTPPCINPDHLFLGTHGDNMNDRLVKGRWKTKISDQDVKTIRSLAARGERKPVIAERFGIHLMNVYKIIRRESWKHV
jgi:HNH endonuclease